MIRLLKLFLVFWVKRYLYGFHFSLVTNYTRLPMKIREQKLLIFCLIILFTSGSSIKSKMILTHIFFSIFSLLQTVLLFPKIIFLYSSIFNFQISFIVVSEVFIDSNFYPISNSYLLPKLFLSQPDFIALQMSILQSDKIF